jgi:hypothetical protein
VAEAVNLFEELVGNFFKVSVLLERGQLGNGYMVGCRV